MQSTFASSQPVHPSTSEAEVVFYIVGVGIAVWIGVGVGVDVGTAVGCAT